jgi:flavin-dependent dehydrogenase
MVQMKEVDVFIIGAGPSGSIAGAKLVQEGFSVKIVDKLKMPRFVIGESLLPRCNELLENANMLECIQEAGFQFKGGAIFENQFDGHLILDFSKNLGQKWGSSFQVKREQFDTLLIKDAENKGCDVEFEVEVIAYDEESNIVTVKNANGEEEKYKAKKVIDGSGYGRVLPRLLNLEADSSLALRRATFARVNNDIRQEGELEGYIIISVVGHNDAWIWNIPFSDGTTSVGIVCTEEFFQSFKMSDEEFWNHIIYTYPPTAARYKNSKRTVEVGSLSGYSAAVTKLFGKNYILTGNASEFLDPVFSSGVTLALESASKAAELTARELKGETIDYQVEYEDYMMMGINVFREYVNAWYDGRLQAIFFSDLKTPELTKKIVSVLSGYVWDESNPLVTDAAFALNTVYNGVTNR